MITSPTRPDLNELRNERLLVERLLANDLFARAPRLHRFLEYITTRTLEGRLDEITEFQIGIHVFDKPSTYNPGDDNIVRSYARTLRKRLEEFFAGEGKDEPVILSVPRGGYIPVFVRRTQVEATIPSSHVSGPAPTISQNAELGPSVSRKPSSMPNSWLLGLLVVGSTIAGACAGYLLRQPKPIVRPPIESAFWALFAGDRNTLIVPSDTGLTILLGLTRQDVRLAEYSTGVYASGSEVRAAVPEGWATPNVHRYCDLVDVSAVAALARLPEFSAERAHIRFARDIRPDDLKTGNVILIGGLNGNPWGQIFQSSQQYRLDFNPKQRSFDVIYRPTRNGTVSKLDYGPQNWSHVSYGLIVLRRNLARNGYILMLQGVSAAGIQAAAEWILDPSNAGRITGNAVDSRGRLVPFEVLLRTDNVGANAMRTVAVGIMRDED